MPASETTQELRIEQIIKLVQAGGFLSQTLKGFEYRPQQQMMMIDVINAYNNDRIALIEAGTGTGKSLAYLIPALFWAAQFKERTHHQRCSCGVQSVSLAASRRRADCRGLASECAGAIPRPP